MADTAGNSIGRKRLNPSALRGKNDARKELVVNSRYSKNVLKSQQTCSVLEISQSYLKSWKSYLKKSNESQLSQGSSKECTAIVIGYLG